MWRLPTHTIAHFFPLHSSPCTIANADLVRAETERSEKAVKPESVVLKSFFRKSPFTSNPQHCPNTSMERPKLFYFTVHLAFILGSGKAGDGTTLALRDLSSLQAAMTSFFPVVLHRRQTAVHSFREAVRRVQFAERRTRCVESGGD